MFCGSLFSIFACLNIVNMAVILTESKLRKIIRETLAELIPDLMDSSIILVEHLTDTSMYVPKRGGTWKDYWEDQLCRKFPSENTKCDCCGKMTKPHQFVGSHVVDVHNRNMKYIYPLCNSCNSKYGKGKEKSPRFFVNKEYCAQWRESESEILHHEE